MIGVTHCGGRVGGFSTLSSSIYHLTSTSFIRRVIDFIRVVKDDPTKANVKKAMLFAKKKERVKFPSYEDGGDKVNHISEFLNHPTGIETMLNVNALENYESLDLNIYRCKLPKIQLLNLEVAPVLDLQVTSTSDYCAVEMLSCKFEGSDIVKQQNERFSASMKNCITWEKNSPDPYLYVDVKLNVILELYNLPFALLPVSAVEGPGNIVLQALLDRLVPLLLQQLLENYNIWVEKQVREASQRKRTMTAYQRPMISSFEPVNYID